MKKLMNFLPFVGFLSGVGLALAGSNLTTVADYTVTGENATHYFVTMAPDPTCSQLEGQVCRISTQASPDSLNRIAKANATPNGWKNAE